MVREGDHKLTAWSKNCFDNILIQGIVNLWPCRSGGAYGLKNEYFVFPCPRRRSIKIKSEKSRKE